MLRRLNRGRGFARPPRGVRGPTSTCRRRHTERRPIPLSADSLEGTVELFDLTSRLHRDYGIENLCIDEIHFIPNYAEQLKRIYDFLPVRVWFTSSVALSLTATGWDLARCGKSSPRSRSSSTAFRFATPNQRGEPRRRITSLRSTVHP